MCFSFCQMLTDGLWIIVMFYQTLILTAPIHCNVMQWHIPPNLMKKQTHLHLGWPEGEHRVQNSEFYLLFRAENVQIKSAGSILVTEDPSDAVSYSYLKHAWVNSVLCAPEKPVESKGQGCGCFLPWAVMKSAKFQISSPITNSFLFWSNTLW